MGNGDASGRRRQYECKTKKIEEKRKYFLEAINKPERRQKYLMRATASDSFLEAFIYLDRLYSIKLK
jgi:hypothetical protein